jgi:hypothetical protein
LLFHTGFRAAPLNAKDRRQVIARRPTAKYIVSEHVLTTRQTHPKVGNTNDWRSLASGMLILELFATPLGADPGATSGSSRSAEKESRFMAQEPEEPVRTSVTAIQVVTALHIDREHIEDLVLRKPLLLPDIGRVIENRRADVRRALAAFGE